jgi:DNA-binding transcriptional MerR regulator
MSDLFSQPTLSEAPSTSLSGVASLPPIPAKRYFTIGEVSELCGVKAHVLRYWEQEFTQLKPLKRRGNHRYYQHHEVLLVRRIRELLYEQGYTIHGARIQLSQPNSNGSNGNGNGHARAHGAPHTMPATMAANPASVPADLKAKLQDIIALLKA